MSRNQEVTANAEQTVSPWLDNLRAARYLNVAPSTLNTWRCRGTGPAYSKIGGRVLYNRADLDEFAAARRVEG